MKTLRFDGQGFEYFKIWIVNILLTIITLGIYYPWAKVRRLRYFYGNTILEDRNFEYHATGKQIFLGYLIALSLFIAYTVIQQISPLGSLIVLGLLFLAIPWVIWRSLMFRMRMTSFSNVRFSFDGKLGQSYINFFLLPIALMLCIYIGPAMAAIVSFVGVEWTVTVGVLMGILVVAGLLLAIYLFALIKKRNSMYMINGSKFGQGRFSTKLKAGVFTKIWFKTMGLGIISFIGYIIVVGIIIGIVAGGAGLLSQIESIGTDMRGGDIIVDAIGHGGMLFLGASMYLGFIVIALLLMAYSHTRQRDYIYANTVLDNKIAFASTLKAKPLAWVMVSNLLAIIFSAGLLIPWAAVRTTKLVMENTQVDTELGFDDYVTQQLEQQSALGDQIGDAFDVDVDIAI